jgi:hypothetical protein
MAVTMITAIILLHFTILVPSIIANIISKSDFCRIVAEWDGRPKYANSGLNNYTQWNS